jgi:hypothetical protein
MSDEFVPVKSITVEGMLTASLLSNGIVQIQFHPDLEQIEIAHLEKIREILFEFGNGKKMPVYFPFTEFVAISKEARADASTEEGGRYTLANAVQLNGRPQQLIFNFFMSVNNPVIATKAFTNRAEAFKWLLKVQAENN